MMTYQEKIEHLDNIYEVIRTLHFGDEDIWEGEQRAIESVKKLLAEEVGEEECRRLIEKWDEDIKESIEQLK